jgi:hypothetical protein
LSVSVCKLSAMSNLQRHSCTSRRIRPPADACEIVKYQNW